MNWANEIELLKRHGWVPPPKPEPKIAFPQSDEVVITTLYGVKSFTKEGGPIRSRMPRRDRHEPGHRPSEIARRGGTRISKRFGIALCPAPKIRPALADRRRFWRRNSNRLTAARCHQPILFRRRQQTARCRECGRRIWLTGLIPLVQHDDFQVIRELAPALHAWRGFGRSPIPSHLVSRWIARAELRVAARKGPPSTGWVRHATESRADPVACSAEQHISPRVSPRRPTGTGGPGGKPAPRKTDEAGPGICRVAWR